MLKSSKLIFLGIILFLIPFSIKADYRGQVVSFFIDSTYDLSQREEISTILKRVGLNAYFYIDEDWWNLLDYQEKQEVEQALYFLDNEFYYKIYPTLTSTFGKEWQLGIDNDSRITVLIHPMIEEAGGYFNFGDEYSRLQVTNSNEREMLYLNANYITEPLAKFFLTHEFMHIITFNQKEKIQEVTEEIWLNEARSEYASTLVKYDDNFENSNLKRRIETFISDPTDSLIEWNNKKEDYGVVNLFIQYLVDQYGVQILQDSLQSDKVGITSINEALEKNGITKTFSEVFTDWTIAVLVNDCTLGEQYCYKNPNLENFKIIPQTNFLPLKGKSTLGVAQTTKNWSGNWIKFIGGIKGILKIEFIGNPENLFKVPYLLKDIFGEYSLGFFQLDEYQRGEILVPEFGIEVSSITIIPSIQNETSDFLNFESSFPFFWEVSTVVEIEEEKESKLIKELLVQIEFLKEEIIKIQALLAKKNLNSFSCQSFETNLYFGMKDNNKVRCLQEFLKSEGSEIYPENLVTGNFLSLTQAAVIRFQEKYASEILNPLGLESGTGFVGQKTRVKINEILSQRS